jgi:hypothetical protein
MRRYGMTEAEIYAALSIANETRCEIPLPSSELSQIVRSVSRYEPDTDLAASAAIGSDAADAILSAVKAGTQEYFFTRATSFLDQPAPLKWVIKGWLPEGSVAMVFGDSGSGKTFFTLDMACRIAAGMEWNGKRTKHGVVVYMAGEGNFGLRQRVAAWCKANKVSKLDNLLISNKGIDMDSPGAPAQIINAVRELTTEAVTIGRASDSTLVIRDDYTSTRHAVLELRRGTWQITDLDSTNGTLVDGKRILTPVDVVPGTPISVGQTVFEIREDS